MPIDGLYDLRPLRMFYEPGQLNGRPVPRFTRITDAKLVAALRAIKIRMYPDG